MGRWSELPHRSGATDAEVASALPGDELVPDASDIVDRCVTLDAPPAEVWPWIAQLGKGRAGWYFPYAVERFLPRKGLRRVAPALQDVHVGDEHADWGPGEPVLRVVDVEPARRLVYYSERGRVSFSWALVLRPEGAQTRLHLRLRMDLRHTRLPVATIGGLFDWATVALLFRGLRERLAA